MREIIIKLLTSDNEEDIRLGKEYLMRFYKEDIKNLRHSGTFSDIIILSDSDLNKVLMTRDFKKPSSRYWIIHRKDMDQDFSTL